MFKNFNSRYYEHSKAINNILFPLLCKQDSAKQNNLVSFYKMYEKDGVNHNISLPCLQGRGRGGVKYKKYAFTLAEVLITIGIIGIVAAMTLPTLVAKYQKHANIVALKKAYSIISQAYIDIIRENGINAGALCYINDSKCLGDLFEPKLKTISTQIWKPQSAIAQGCWEDKNIANPNETHYCIITNDGISFDFDMEYSDNFLVEDKELTIALINIDTNGTKRPNQWGKDRFLLSIHGYKIIPYKEATTNDNFVPKCADGKGDIWANQNCAYTYLYLNK